MRLRLASLGCTACREAARWLVVRRAWVLPGTWPPAVRAARALRLVDEMYSCVDTRGSVGGCGCWSPRQAVAGRGTGCTQSCGPGREGPALRCSLAATCRHRLDAWMLSPATRNCRRSCVSRCRGACRCLGAAAAHQRLGVERLCAHRCAHKAHNLRARLG